MLRMDGVSKIYRTEFVETHALNHFSLHVEEREFIALMGPSGSGKSTFLNAAGLLDDFDSGTYHLAGEDVRSLNDRQRSRIRNRSRSISPSRTSTEPWVRASARRFRENMAAQMLQLFPRS